ncbi:hypothetical protein [Oceanobacter mangrovi]|uniref:hypothetical protein n=1 Tax=Oceanobacter mangrovi TaxID=2862510 RepID=UPI001C8EC665|nr:hypothetical protein [Oceanobacter mangrovi]
MPEMTPAELSDLMERAAEKGTNTALTRLGFDVENHLEAQKDQAFVRSQRKASEQISTVTRRTLIGLVITGLVSLLVVGIQHGITPKP